MAWHQLGAKPLPEPMLTETHKAQGYNTSIGHIELTAYWLWWVPTEYLDGTMSYNGSVYWWLLLPWHYVRMASCWMDTHPDNKAHGANMGPTWVLLVPDGPHDGPMNLAIRAGCKGRMMEGERTEWTEISRNLRMVSFHNKDVMTWNIFIIIGLFCEQTSHSLPES